MDQDEGVDNLTACVSVMLKGSFLSWQSLLESELLLRKRKKKTKKPRMSGIVSTLSLLSISYRHFQMYFPLHFHPL